MTENKTKAVPRFASFRPRVQESDESTRGLKPETSDRDSSILENKDEREREHNGNAHCPKSHHRHYDRRKSGFGSLPQKVETFDLTSIKPSNIFIVDKRGDQQNLKYGLPHRYAIPQHRRGGKGWVVGSGNKIDRQGSDERAIVLSDVLLKDASRILSLSSWKPNKTKHSELSIRQTPETKADQDERSLDFIPLSTISSTPTPSELERSESSEDNLETGQWEGSAENPELDLIRAEKARLWNNARNKRTDLEAWLVYIDWLEEHRSLASASSEMEFSMHTIISTYEEALENLREQKAHEMLVMRMMSLGREIWDDAETQQRWRRYSAQHPLSRVLWQKSADNDLTAPDFHHDNVQRLYLTRLSFLQAKRHQEVDVMSRCDNETRRNQHRSMLNLICGSQMQTLLRFTIVLRDAGYVERGIAIWQAMLELNFRLPAKFEGLRVSKANQYETMLDSLDGFWENGAARIGEQDARGWSAYSQSAESNWSPTTDAVNPATGSLATWESWAEIERKSASLDTMPARYEDETHEADNARIIMFSDVREPLFISPDQDPTSLLNAFLTFCNLPPLDDLHWNGDSAVVEVSEQSRGNLLMQDHLLDKPLGATPEFSLDPVTQCNTWQYRCPPESYLLSPNWFSPFNTLSNTDLNVSIKHFACRVLAQLVGDCRTFAKIYGIYYLGLESRLFPEEMEKKAKALFKRYKSDDELSDVFCNAYARILAQLGRWDAARSVFETAIRVGAQTGARMDVRKIQHLHELIWGFLERNSLSEAKKVLEENMGLLPGTTMAGDMDGAQEGQIYSLMLLHHYFRGSRCSLPAAMDAHRSYESKIPTEFLRSTTLEICHQYKARLLYYDAMHHAFASLSPVAMREQLTNSMVRFPHNAIFQTLYAWNERRCGAGVALVANAVLHTPNDAHPFDAETVTPYLLAIQNALSSDPVPGASNVVRSTFERAVTAEAGRHCPGLWYWYLRWEFSLTLHPSPSPSVSSRARSTQEETEQTRRKGIWWRAVGACPWVKAFYMLAVEDTGRRAMGMDDTREMEAVFEMMDTRELRIRMRDMVPKRSDERRIP